MLFYIGILQNNQPLASMINSIQLIISCIIGYLLNINVSYFNCYTVIAYISTDLANSYYDKSLSKNTLDIIYNIVLLV